MPRAIPILFLAAIAMIGCGPHETLPPLFPAEGQVVDNGVPVKGGVISLRKVDDQKLLSIGAEVGQDGHFTLVTVQERTKHPGAPAGEYQVVYSPPVLGKNAFPITLPRTIEITSKDNKLLIDLAANE